jgi:hypothetical protein
MKARPPRILGACRLVNGVPTRCGLHAGRMARGGQRTGLDIGMEVGGTQDPGTDCAGSRGSPRGSEGHQVRRWDMHHSTAATHGTHVGGLVLAAGAGPPMGAYIGRAGGLGEKSC